MFQIKSYFPHKSFPHLMVIKEQRVYVKKLLKKGCPKNRQITACSNKTLYLINTAKFIAPALSWEQIRATTTTTIIAVFVNGLFPYYMRCGSILEPIKVLFVFPRDLFELIDQHQHYGHIYLRERKNREKKERERKMRNNKNMKQKQNKKAKSSEKDKNSERWHNFSLCRAINETIGE